ncbi:NRAMP family divalent metal transporter [Kitasatospora sp. GP82]|uniref:NRAMP family divalent metal transporter n=1 Tax=Kitasatospora sp. GP82 TaxID=3035089 RepID=UPI002475F222|nr:NRAMP family divalent metal transporter [Kitasatospora sp. GP82]MDH6125741.1 Mn2+/Fe2+ NRAMP family transporter [Kitasatospora sp. GP82]
MSDQPTPPGPRHDQPGGPGRPAPQHDRPAAPQRPAPQHDRPAAPQRPAPQHDRPAAPAAAPPAAPQRPGPPPAAPAAAPAAKPSAHRPGPAAVPHPPAAATEVHASAVLDEAHLGDIEGALGRIRLDEDDSTRSLKRRLLTFLAIIGPGLIVMVGDNDAGGVSTYAQAGQNYGYSLLWVLLLLVPVLIVNQEMVVRLGAVTGVGHARLINERFGRFWGWFSVGDLFVLNFLTIVTEFIGVSLALSYFGISKYIAVPVAALALIAITASGSFRRWERAMLTFIAVSLVLVPLALLSRPRYGSVFYHLVVPGIQGGVSSDAVLLIIAIVGTTVAPWQLFFQQSNIIDKRITPRFIGHERLDTVIGSLVVVLGAVAIIIAADYAVRGTSAAGHFTDALGVAEALGDRSTTLGALFAIMLLDASIVGAAAVTLATSYAFGDVFNLRHSLHRSFGEAKAFYGSYTAMVLLAAAIVLVPGAPLGLITTAVQALAGLLLPSASVFLLLLCNDRAVLGPWTNPRWLNLLASLIISVLLMLSGVLVATTLFPGLNTTLVAEYLSAAFALGLLAAALGLRTSRARHRPARPSAPEVARSERDTWRMPPLALLEPVVWSPGLRLGMGLLRGYLVVAALLLIVKAVQLGG